MAWFDRQRGEMEPRAAFDALSAAFTASAIDAALVDLCGSPGLRRFVVRFEDSRRGLRVTGIESEAVKGGGGPPPPQSATHAIPGVERALSALRRLLPAPFAFERGAIGVVLDRDPGGKPMPLDVTVRLDEDGDAFRLGDLRAPKGPGVPVEQAEYVAALSAWSEQINRMRGGWKMCRGRQVFTIEGHRLTIGSGTADAGSADAGSADAGSADAGSADAESLVVALLGTWDARNGAFTWLVDRPVSTEAPFIEPELNLTMGQVTELMAFAAAKLGALGVFQGETARALEDAQRAGLTVFAAIR